LIQSVSGVDPPGGNKSGKKTPRKGETSQTLFSKINFPLNPYTPQTGKPPTIQVFLPGKATRNKKVSTKVGISSSKDSNSTNPKKRMIRALTVSIDLLERKKQGKGAATL